MSSNTSKPNEQKTFAQKIMAGFENVEDMSTAQIAAGLIILALIVVVVIYIYKHKTPGVALAPGPSAASSAAFKYLTSSTSPNFDLTYTPNL